MTVLILQLVKSLPLNIPEAWKKYPSRAEPTQIGHYKEYLSPPPDCIFPIFKTVCCIFCRKVLSERWGESFSLCQAECWIHCEPVFHSMMSSHSWLVFTKSKLIPPGKQDQGEILFSKCMKFMVECEQITKTDWFLCRFLFSMERNRQLFKR